MNISKLTLTLLLCLSVSSVVASHKGSRSSGSGDSVILSGSHNSSGETDGSDTGATATAAVRANSAENKRAVEALSNVGTKADIAKAIKKVKLFFKRKALRPSVVSAAITYAIRAAYNKSNFVESNNKALGYGIVGTASILLAVKKARKWLNSSEEAADVVRPAAVATADLNSRATAHAGADSVSVSGSSLPPAAATAYPVDSSVRASVSAATVGMALPQYNAPAPFYSELRPLRRDASMFDLAHVGEAAIGVNSDLLEALVGIGAGILAPMPSLLK